MATKKDKIVSIEVNHTIDQMIAFQKIWIKSMKMQRGMSAEELDALSICEDILAVLEVSKKGLINIEDLRLSYGNKEIYN